MPTIKKILECANAQFTKGELSQTFILQLQTLLLQALIEEKIDEQKNSDSSCSN